MARKIIGKGSYCTIYTSHNPHYVYLVGKTNQNQVKIAVLRYFGLIRKIHYVNDTVIAQVKKLEQWDKWTEEEKQEVLTLIPELDRIVDQWVNWTNHDPKNYLGSILGMLDDMISSSALPKNVRAVSSHLREKINTNTIKVTRGIIDHRDTAYIHKPVHTGNWLRDSESRELYPYDLFNFK